jgi:PadR family transcriptional regulator, regulatory protein PadR
MPSGPNDKLQGTLTLLVLRALAARGPLHGYAICEHIRSASDELLQVEEGSLYPALHRMQQDDWVSSEWVVTDKGRKARVYTITASGHRRLEEELEKWARLTRGVTRVLKHA